jgi:hypothetical protein
MPEQVDLDALFASLTPDSPTIVLLDKGGFVWWTHEDRRGEWWLHGVAGPKNPDENGLATEAWMNIFKPDRAKGYGPFRRLT